MRSAPIVPSLFVLAAVLASPLVSAALADEYTCDDEGPCIVDATDLGHYRVALTWSGQGTPYDFFKIIVGLHGGGDPKEYPVKGRKGGKGRFDLVRAGDYEITVAGAMALASDPLMRAASRRPRRFG